MLCPVHPFATTWHFPSRGNKEFEEKNRESYTSCTILAFPLWWLAPPPCPVGSISLDSRVAYSSPMNPVPLPPPQFGGAAKGKRLNGQARRLTSPHLEVLCRTSTGDYKAPLCCELLMRGLLCGSLLSHRSAGGRWCRKAPKGGKPPEVADYRSTYHTI